jgi:hypothetical protein
MHTQPPNLKTYVQDQGLVLSTKILRSEKFSEKVRKFLNLPFVPRSSQNLSSCCLGLASLLEV